MTEQRRWLITTVVSIVGIIVAAIWNGALNPTPSPAAIEPERAANRISSNPTSAPIRDPVPRTPQTSTPSLANPDREQLPTHSPTNSRAPNQPVSSAQDVVTVRFTPRTRSAGLLMLRLKVNGDPVGDIVFAPT